MFLGWQSCHPGMRERQLLKRSREAVNPCPLITVAWTLMTLSTRLQLENNGEILLQMKLRAEFKYLNMCTQLL